MRALHRRLPRLEDRFGPPVETQYMHQLQRGALKSSIGALRRGAKPNVLLLPRVPVAGLALAEAIFQDRERTRKSD
jgi:hypothetical protein